MREPAPLASLWPRRVAAGLVRQKERLVHWHLVFYPLCRWNREIAHEKKTGMGCRRCADGTLCGAARIHEEVDPLHWMDGAVRELRDPRD